LEWYHWDVLFSLQVSCDLPLLDLIEIATDSEQIVKFVFSNYPNPISIKSKKLKEMLRTIRSSFRQITAGQFPLTVNVPSELYVSSLDIIIYSRYFFDWTINFVCVFMFLCFSGWIHFPMIGSKVKLTVIWTVTLRIVIISKSPFEKNSSNLFKYE
jgi:hypothetical protein